MKKILVLLLTILLSAPAFSIETKENNISTTTQTSQATDEIKEIVKNMDNYNLKVSDELTKEPTEKQKQAIFMMNYAQYVTYKLITYNNVIVLDEEYSILNDNMNLQTIKDIASIDTILSLTNMLFKETKRNEKINILKKSIQQRMNRALYNSIAQGVSQIRVSGSDLISMGTSLAISTLKAGTSCFIGYQQYKDELSKEYDEKIFEYQETKETDLHNLYQQLISYSFILIQKYDISDEWRVNKVQLEEMIEYMKDSNKERAFGNLKRMSVKRYIQHFPMFWYYLAKTALDIGKEKEALKYYNRFEKENIYIFRYDKIAVDAYKGKISILLKDKDKNKKEIVEKLEFIEKNKTTWEDYYYCALVYTEINDNNNAQRLLETNISELSAKVDNNFIAAKNLQDITDKFVGDNNYDGLEISRALLRNLKNQTFPNISIKDEYEKNTQAFNEYLYYFGLQPSNQLIDNSIKDIKEILVSIDSKWCFFNQNALYDIKTGTYLESFKNGMKAAIPGFHKFVVDVKIPMQWVISSDAKLYAVFIKTSEKEILQKQEELEKAKEKLEKVNTRLKKAKEVYDKTYETLQKFIDNSYEVISEYKALLSKEVNEDLKKAIKKEILQAEDEVKELKEYYKNKFDENKKDNYEFDLTFYYRMVKKDYELTQKLVDDLNKTISEAKLLQSKENDKISNILTNKSLNDIKDNKNIIIIPMELNEKKLNKLKKQKNIHDECVLIYTTDEITKSIKDYDFLFGGILLKHNMYPVLFRYKLSIDETYEDIIPSSVFFNHKEYEIK